MNGPKAGVYVKCRCGDQHPLREQEVCCVFCKGPTWDHHAVCAGCRGAEALARHAEKVIELVAQVAEDCELAP